MTAVYESLSLKDQSVSPEAVLEAVSTMSPGEIREFYVMAEAFGTPDSPDKIEAVMQNFLLKLRACEKVGDALVGVIRGAGTVLYYNFMVQATPAPKAKREYVARRTFTA